MKRAITYLSLLLVFISCNKNAKEESVKPEKITETNIPPAKNEQPQLMAMLKLDTYANGEKADKVCVYDLKLEYDKDSICTRYYKIVFLKNDNALYEYRGKIRSDPGDWDIDEKVMNDKKQDSYDKRFIQISNGYPACGYTHTHLLFYLGDSDIGMIKEWRTMWDSGYGNDVEFYPVIKDNKTSRFSTVNVLVDQASMKDDSAMLEITYSDSVSYEIQNGRWIGTNITPADKVYRTLQTTFDDYYKN